MKIVIIGASGTIGKAVAESLREDFAQSHEIITAGRHQADISVDLGDPKTITAMMDRIGGADAIVSTAGQAKFGPLAEQSDDDYQLALSNKLMGQINLVRYGHRLISPGGSITLTSGILSRHPIPASASVAMANGALESFVRAAALELKDLRLNVVAPAFVKETMEMMGMDSASGISAADTAKAYVAAVTGDMHGETLDVSRYL